MDLLVQMRTFVRIAETGSLSRAARSLRLSLAAVSRQLSALERDLGVPLVLRSTRRLSLTEAGRAYHSEAVRILGSVERARETVRGSRRVEGRVVVCAGVSIGLHAVVPALPRLAARHPGLVVDLLLEDRPQDLIEDAVDLAVRVGESLLDSTSIVAQRVGTFRRILVASAAYLEARGMPRTPGELQRHATLVQPQLEPGRGVWRLVGEEGAEVVRVEGRMACNAPLALRELALAGLGVALLPEWLVAEDLAKGRLRRVLPELASPEVPVSALYRVEQRGWPRLRPVLEALREGFPAQAGGGRPLQPAVQGEAKAVIRPDRDAHGPRRG
ncbi:MAG TPA: LysR family transcriptional regulator [Myxococcaceae bacterium]|nr:LysR family transcriptional regulator [Myxococcaceae bacterium]